MKECEVNSSSEIRAALKRMYGKREEESTYLCLPKQNYGFDNSTNLRDPPEDANGCR